jgi:hypothetical protein
MKTIALLLFVLMYLVMLVFEKARAAAAVSCAALFVVLGVVPSRELAAAVDWNVLLMILGTMGLVSLFIESRMPSRLADIIMDKMPNVKWAVVSLCLFAGLISAFVDNVATVLMIAPVALAVCRKLRISPVSVVIAIAVSSNLQGAATLVGDTTSILLGGYAGMDFFDFFVFFGRPGMFWVVQAGAVASALILLFYFRRLRAISVDENTLVTDYFPSLLMGRHRHHADYGLVSADKPPATNGIICVGCFLTAPARRLYKKGLSELSKRSAKLTGARFSCSRACSSSLRASAGWALSTISAACSCRRAQTICF